MRTESKGLFRLFPCSSPGFSKVAILITKLVNITRKYQKKTTGDENPIVRNDGNWSLFENPQIILLEIWNIRQIVENVKNICHEKSEEHLVFARQKKKKIYFDY